MNSARHISHKNHIRYTYKRLQYVRTIRYSTMYSTRSVGVTLSIRVRYSRVLRTPSTVRSNLPGSYLTLQQSWIRQTGLLPVVARPAVNLIPSNRYHLKKTSLFKVTVANLPQARAIRSRSYDSENIHLTPTINRRVIGAALHTLRLLYGSVR